MLGKKFGRLTVLAFSHKDKWRKNYWLCLCSCGKQIIVRDNALTSGNTKSCGCLRKEISTKRQLKHGLCRTRLYRIWCDMKNRCYNKNVDAYKNYGARGISLCSSWLLSFQQFSTWAYANGYNDTLTIDRVDNNGNYCPSNCRWITIQEQQKNRRNNKEQKIC